MRAPDKHSIQAKRRDFIKSTSIGTTLLTLGSFGAVSMTSQPVVAQDSQNWLSAGGDAANTGYKPGRQGPINLGEKWTFEIEYKIETSPLIFNGTVYVAGEDRTLYAINQDTGELAWKKEFDADFDGVTPAISNGKIYLTTSNGKLYAIDLDSQEAVWEQNINNDQDITVADGTVYCADYDIIAFNAENGEEKWQYEGGGSLTTAPTAASGSVYFGDSDGRVSSITTTGEKEWEFQAYDDILGAPAVIDGIVYFGSDDHYLYAINADDGTELWRFDSSDPIHMSPAVTKTTVYANGIAVDRENGKPIDSVSSNYLSQSPIVVDNVAYIFDGNDIIAYDREQTAMINSVNLGEISGAAVSNGTLFVTTTDNSLYALGEIERVSVEGRVVDTDRQPIEAAEVQFIPDGSDSPETVIQTNADGVYEAELAAGVSGTLYSIKVMKDGYITKTKEQTITSAGAAIDFTLSSEQEPEHRSGVDQDVWEAVTDQNEPTDQLTFEDLSDGIDAYENNSDINNTEVSFQDLVDLIQWYND